jgi:hypothetical protein
MRSRCRFEQSIHKSNYYDMRKTIHDIHEEVVKKLNTPEGLERVRQRREKMKALEVALKNLRESNPELLLRGRRKAWFSTTQSDAARARGDVRVQVLGVEAGTLKLEGDPLGYFFYPKKENFPKAVGRWKWSDNRRDAKQIRDFLKECEHHPKAKPENEREIQWQFGHALRAKKSIDSALRHLQPVTWNKRSTEVGVSLTRDGNLGTRPGTIDLVVRRGVGGRRGFLIFELKRPGDTNVEAALHQAIRYAITLHIEANGDGVPETYNSVFGSGSRGELRFGAVLVMENSEIVRRAACERLLELCSDCGTSPLDRIGVLLYRFDREKRRAHSWTWLDGWDGRTTDPRAFPKRP